MLNKFSMGILSILVSTSTLANTGFYVGAGIGPQSADFDQRARVIVVPPGGITVSNVKDTTHLSGTGIFGTIFGGYGWSRNQFYLAGEANANLSSVEFKSENLEFISGTFSHTKYKMTYNLGLSLLPGYLYTLTTLFYGRIGYAYGNFKISTSDSSIANVNRNLSGLRLGLGVNQTFTQHLGARMEYSHTCYDQTSFTVVDGPATKTTKIRPSTGQVEFSLIYNFA